jgi:hypothetical protein
MERAEGRWVRKGGGFNYCVQRHPHWSSHAVLPLARTFLCKKKYNLPGNGKEFCFQQGNKDITLFLMNPTIIAIPKQIRVRKCRKSKSYSWGMENLKNFRGMTSSLMLKVLYN